MFHVPKEDEMGCAVATAAMIAGLTYEQVAGRCRGCRPADLRYAHRLRRLLADLTATPWRRAWLWRPRPVREFPLPDWPVAVFLQDCWWRPHFGQWAAASGKLIHDPALGVAVSVADYLRQDWFVTHLLEPTRPARLARGENPARLALVLEELSAEIGAALRA
jgi:hypothetical protein